MSDKHTYLHRCPGCGQLVFYSSDEWRNYSSKPGSGTVYVCGQCADDPSVVSAIESTR